MAFCPHLIKVQDYYFSLLELIIKSQSPKKWAQDQFDALIQNYLTSHSMLHFYYFESTRLFHVFCNEDGYGEIVLTPSGKTLDEGEVFFQLSLLTKPIPQTSNFNKQTILI